MENIEWLRSWGWSAARAEAWVDSAGLEPARVTGAFGSEWSVVCASGSLRATARARLRGGEARSGPVVGDWVALRSDGAVIESVLPRTSLIVRKAAGEGSQAQPLVANADVALAVMSLDRDFNLRRLERYLAVLYDSGVAPWVVLTKRDLVKEVDGYLDAVASVAQGCRVWAVSADTGEAMDALGEALRGHTAVAVGSSGAGKSTLLNALLGEAVQATGGLDRVGVGRHTTTRREMRRGGDGLVVIDTPGMRELGLYVVGDGLEAAFADVLAVAQGCRFRDCTHSHEAGCAVREALDAGALDPSRLASMQKLQREAAHALRRDDKRAAAEARAVWKQRSRDAHAWMKLKGR